MNARAKQNKSPWLAIALCALLAATGLALAALSDSAWKIPLLIGILACCLVAVGLIVQMHESNRDLRARLARLEAQVEAAPKPDQPKGVYSVDDDGQRRLHISRLE
jgi:hypothetical protein